MSRADANSWNCGKIDAREPCQADSRVGEISSMSSKHGSAQNKDMALIFLHVPKAGGVTLHSVIERQYPERFIFHIDGNQVGESIEEFKSLPEEGRAQITCLKGHMRFGLHKYLPQPATYITILRDPIDRMISHYYYVKRAPNHWLHKEVISRNMDLGTYISSGIASQLNNGQVRLISGMVSGNDPVSTDALEVAKRNLRECFLAVGLIERFDQSLILFRKLLGWKNIYYVKRNVTVGRPSKKEISPQTLRTVEEYNALDMELYEFANRMFEEKLREEEVGDWELMRFRLLNRTYRMAYGLVKALPMRGVRRLLRCLKFKV